MAVENQGGALLAVGACFMTVAWLCVLLRTYVRVYLVKAFGLDDWLIVASVVRISRVLWPNWRLCGRLSAKMGELMADSFRYRYSTQSTTFGCSLVFTMELDGIMLTSR